MILRVGEPGDAAAIAAIWNDVITHTAATFTTELKDATTLAQAIADSPQRWHVALLDGDILGFATFFPFRGGPGYRHTFEHTIHLSPKAQGQGVGRALMVQLEQAAKDDGAHSLFAGVSGENHAGVAFHRALGYSEVAHLPEVGRKFDRWMDLVLMQKFL